MDFPIPKNRLRLVGVDEPPSRQVFARAHPKPSTGAIADVQRETLDAARLSALDARWILAVQVDRAITGGRAGVITPEDRNRLMILGSRVGLRPFDASLVIAIVQDAARSGEDPLGRLAEDRLRLVRQGDIDVTTGMSHSASTPGRFSSLVLLAICTLVLASIAAWLLARWILA